MDEEKDKKIMKDIMDAIGTGKTAEAETESKDTHLKSVVDAIGSFTDVKKPTEKKPTDTK